MRSLFRSCWLWAAILWTAPFALLLVVLLGPFLAPTPCNRYDVPNPDPALPWCPFEVSPGYGFVGYLFLLWIAGMVFWTLALIGSHLVRWIRDHQSAPR